MKNSLTILALLLFMGHAALAQFKEDPVLNLQNEDKKFLNWGYFLGFNRYDFQFDYKENKEEDILVTGGTGFNVGLIGEMRLNEFLDARFEPGLLYTTRTLKFPFFGNESDAIREARSIYIRFPLLLKVNTRRFGNWKPYVTGGMYTALNLGSKQDSQEDNSSDTFRMKKQVYGYQIGFGIDFYLEYFKFSPSITGVFALTDELVPDNDSNSSSPSPWTGNLNGMRTRGIFINFTFE